MSYRKKRRPKVKRKGISKLGLYVGFSILLCIVYTTIVLLIFSSQGSEPETLTTCFFAFFGGEIVTSALIKVFNIKGESNSSNTNEMEDKANDE